MLDNVKKDNISTHGYTSILQS